MGNLPKQIWARVLCFAAEATATITARVVYSAVPICLAEIASHKGVAQYIHTVTTPRITEAFAFAMVFCEDVVLARHFASKLSITQAYLRTSPHPSLSGLAAWLFQRPALQPLLRSRHRRTSPNTLGLSFGLVREPLGWRVSMATTQAVAADLLQALHGLARRHRPDFQYIWAHISTSPTTRHPFTFSRDAVVVSLSSGRSYNLSGGEVAPEPLLEPGVIVSFNSPVPLSDVKEMERSVLQRAGFILHH